MLSLWSKRTYVHQLPSSQQGSRCVEAFVLQMRENGAFFKGVQLSRHQSLLCVRDGGAYIEGMPIGKSQKEEGKLTFALFGFLKVIL